MDLYRAFFEKIILLVLTALITGFGIPYVLKRVEERKLREQKRFEAELSRQEKIIDAQSKLLDDLSQLLWKWRYLAKKVVYYGALGSTEQERYEIVKRQYDENSWDFLQDFRSLISRARRLVSEDAYDRLNSLYQYIVKDVDMKVSLMIRTGEPDTTRAAEMSDRFSKEVSKRVDDALNDLASELSLRAKS